jgi:hypothetical protein
VTRMAWARRRPRRVVGLGLLAGAMTWALTSGVWTSQARSPSPSPIPHLAVKSVTVASPRAMTGAQDRCQPVNGVAPPCAGVPTPTLLGPTVRIRVRTHERLVTFVQASLANLSGQPVSVLTGVTLDGTRVPPLTTSTLADGQATEVNFRRIVSTTAGVHTLGQVVTAPALATGVVSVGPQTVTVVVVPG